MKSFTSGWVQVSPWYQKSSNASLFRNTQSMTCGDSWRRNADRQAIGDDGGRVGNRDRKARLRAPGLQEIFHPRPVPAQRRRNEYSAGYTGLGGRKVRHLYDVVVDKLFRQSGVGGDLNGILASHDLYLA